MADDSIRTRGCCWRAPAATARASSARSTRSSGCSSSTARRSTCASRSCTTSTSCGASRSAARSSWRSEQDVPEGAICVLSAHGVAPEVLPERRRHATCSTVDATCPLVTKVHKEARRFAEGGYTIFLVGHAAHEEVVGTKGEAPDAITLVESVADVDGARRRRSRARRLRDPDDAVGGRDERESSPRLRERFPAIIGPPKDDICYATTNRQLAVKSLAREVDLVLVIGSANSSNSQRLVDVHARSGRRRPPDRRRDPHRRAWLDGRGRVGITSGASAPEWLVERRGRVVPRARRRRTSPSTM